MSTAQLDDAEALRNLWDETTALAHDARRLADLTQRLSFTTRRFSQTWLDGAPDDPRHLLTECGALAELVMSVDRATRGVEECLEALGFVCVPRPPSDPQLDRTARAELALRVARFSPNSPARAPGAGPSA